jgi:hypothetical protein
MRTIAAITGRCADCRKKRVLTREHEALGLLCEPCGNALDWNRPMSGVMPGAFEQGRNVRASRGSNRVS